MPVRGLNGDLTELELGEGFAGVVGAPEVAASVEVAEGALVVGAGPGLLVVLLAGGPDGGSKVGAPLAEGKEGLFACEADPGAEGLEGGGKAVGSYNLWLRLWWRLKKKKWCCQRQRYWWAGG